MAHLMSATAKGIQYGIEVNEGVLTLGETGRNRREVRVAVDPAMGRRPEVGNVIRRSGLLSIAPGEPNDAVVVRVKTRAGYTRGAPGRFHHGTGWTTLAEGFHAWGDAGNLGVMPDLLLAVRGSDEGVCHAIFSGGGYGDGSRWLLALQRGFDWPSVVMIDCRPDALPHLRPAEVLIDDEPSRVLKMIRAIDETPYKLEPWIREDAERALAEISQPTVQW